MEPTITFRPFGLEGPRVLLFGKPTGDWNPSRLRNGYNADQGLHFALSRLGEKYGFTKLFFPKPTECNAQLVTETGFTESVMNGACGLQVMMGVCADAMVLSHGSAGAIASADCPTIITYCPTTKKVIMAHAGAKSLVDLSHFIEGQPARNPGTVVDSVVKEMMVSCCSWSQVFITCGIERYHHPALARHIFTGVPDCSAVHGEVVYLKRLIAEQFKSRGFGGVTTDLIDTLTDRDKKDYLWHSYRRGKTPEEKAGRNLVLVVNR